jgi:SdpC family antimicrobial peptide
MKKLMILLSATTVLLSCSKSTKTENTANDRQISKVKTDGVQLSDQDIFRAIMFLDGTASFAIEDFQDYSISSLTEDQSKIQSVNATRNQILATINNGQPNYLSNFRTEVTSGDEERVKNAIFAASDLILKISAEMHNVTEENFRASVNVIANDFKNQHNLNYNSTKSAYINTIKSQLGACSDLIVAVCAVVLANTSIDVNTAFVIAKAGNSQTYSTYEAQRFVSLVTLNFGSI